MQNYNSLDSGWQEDVIVLGKEKSQSMFSFEFKAPYKTIWEPIKSMVKFSESPNVLGFETYIFKWIIEELYYYDRHKFITGGLHAYLKGCEVYIRFAKGRVKSHFMPSLIKRYYDCADVYECNWYKGDGNGDYIDTTKCVTKNAAEELGYFNFE